MADWNRRGFLGFLGVTVATLAAGPNLLGSVQPGEVWRCVEVPGAFDDYGYIIRRVDVLTKEAQSVFNLGMPAGGQFKGFMTEDRSAVERWCGRDAVCVMATIETERARHSPDTLARTVVGCTWRLRG